MQLNHFEWLPHDFLRCSRRQDSKYPTKAVSSNISCCSDVADSETLTYSGDARFEGPVLHEVADDVEERYNVDAGLTHPIVAYISYQLGSCALEKNVSSNLQVLGRSLTASLDIGPDAITFFPKSQSQESGA